MRAAACAVLLLLALCQGDALQCNYCATEQGGPCTIESIQTCAGENGCAQLVIQGSTTRSIRQCMDFRECRSFLSLSNVRGNCCQTNRCN